MISLFGRVTKYASGDREQRENRLTECFAAVLERVDGLAALVVTNWMGDGPPELLARIADPDLDVTVDTQVYLRVDGQKRFADLSLRFGDRSRPSSDDALVLVEVKHGTGPHTNQVAAYRKALGRLGVRPERAGVVLLAPRRQLPYAPPEVPLGVPQVSWEETGQVLTSAQRARDGGEAMLLTELSGFLEEEGLMDVDAVTPAHLVAMREQHAAWQALGRITEIADAWIDDRWGAGRPKSNARGTVQHGVGFYSVHEMNRSGTEARTWPEGCWFDWNLVEDWDRAQPSTGALVFMAGLSADRGSPLDARGISSDWIQSVDGDGRLGFRRFDDGCWRFNRVAYPEEVVVGRDLREQGESVGCWVVAAFEALALAGPPERPAAG